jgi:integrase
MLSDGGNLFVQATIGRNGNINRSFVFRYEMDGRRHDLGLGSVYDLRLADARERRRELRLQILAGIDPLDARNEQKAERRARTQANRATAARAQTFRQCATRYLEVHGGKWKNTKHAGQWPSSLEKYVYPIIGDLNVADIDEAHLVRVLQPIWNKIPETARRLRARIEAILGYATVSRFRVGDNPARWRNHLQTLLGSGQKVVEHHPAVAFAEAPLFMAELRARPRKSPSALAMEFLILTAARTSEVIGAQWSEIDLRTKTWTVPASRMKAGKEHRVPLCARAIEILQSLDQRSEFVFTIGTITRRPLGGAAMRALLKDMKPGATIHGFRSMFRDWAAERTNYQNHVVEQALAHKIPDAVEAAYRRGDLFEKRRRLMQEWDRFLTKPLPASATVTPLRAAADA